MRIQPITQLQQTLPNIGKPPVGETNDDFVGTLMDVLKEVNSSQLNSAKMQTDFQAGRTADIADVKIAMEKASLSLNLTLQVRNKILEAYQEISRMQI